MEFKNIRQPDLELKPIMKMRKLKVVVPIILCLIHANLFAQSNPGSKMSNSLFSEELVKPRMRVIIDNDFGGDPDGLIQLVHHLLSPSVEIRGIIGSHLRPGDGWDPSKETATNAKKKAEEVLSIMNLGKTIPV